MSYVDGSSDHYGQESQYQQSMQDNSIPRASTWRTSRGSYSDSSSDDPSRPAVSQPAHPLPAIRHGITDFDQYLQGPTSKFQIFSAEEKRKRTKAIVIGAAAGLVIIAVALWVVFG